MVICISFASSVGNLTQLRQVYKLFKMSPNEAFDKYLRIEVLAALYHCLLKPAIRHHENLHWASCCSVFLRKRTKKHIARHSKTVTCTRWIRDYLEQAGRARDSVFTVQDLDNLLSQSFISRISLQIFLLLP